MIFMAEISFGLHIANCDYSNYKLEDYEEVSYLICNSIHGRVAY